MASKYLKNKQDSRKLLLVLIAVLVFLILLILDRGGFVNWQDVTRLTGLNDGVVEQEGKLYAHFINVGQGDCSLIKCGDDTVMIDTGEPDSFNAVKAYLNLYNVKEIDYLILTHMHSDHIGSAADIIRKYNVGKVIITKLDEENIPTLYCYEDLLDVLAEGKCEVYAARTGDSYEVGSFSFDLLGPVLQNAEDLNDTSVIVKIKYGNFSILYMGDASSAAETELLINGTDVSADVIKLGHHGSNSSSCGEFLNAVRPQAAIISCGLDNPYGHPGKYTLKRLEARGIKYYRTDISGNITVISDTESFTVKEQGENNYDLVAR
ncbi:MAG: MBL fold metallo-hydrolase [Ruminococcaceae bacterium]|nr:MBL fold metallo-hydrolase [Oscillospiraceae bacterium]